MPEMTDNRLTAPAMGSYSGPHIVVPLRFVSPVAVAAGRQPLTFGLPIAKGQLVTEEPAAQLVDGQGRTLTVQTAQLAVWSDGSVKWLRVDCLTPELVAGDNHYELHVTDGGQLLQPPEPAMRNYHLDGAHGVDTGVVAFEFDYKTFMPLKCMRGDCRPTDAMAATKTLLTDRSGILHELTIDTIPTMTRGPVRTTVELAGHVDGLPKIRFRGRITCFAGTGLVKVQLTLHNTRPARHSGGRWDLGDSGSFFFQDLSISAQLEGETARCSYRIEASEQLTALDGAMLDIYQDSSGGENWQSRIHVNHEGRVPSRLPGCQVRTSTVEMQGRRATPIVEIEGDAARLTVSMPEFWQQFPKQLEVNGGQVRARLFPESWGDLFELQGGERKTHVVWFDFAPVETASTDLAWTHQPARAILAPEYYAACGVVPHVQPSATDADHRLNDYLNEALTGPNNLFAKREVVDEFGWRNFGDLWGDHEQAYYTGPQPIISQYNNQFDVIDGAIRQLMRSGDPRWFDIFDPLARHVMDIDIYHTTRDKAAYCGGLFWFTDHYLDAATSTHRTFSQANAPQDGGPYGGGPGSEHNFATGLLHYHYLTGDPDAAEAVVTLADWVLAMDDGRKNVLGLIDDGDTGLASMCGDFDYHGPGRGAANSIQVLLDAWLLTAKKQYLHKAEALIRRSIHPEDDIESLHLLDAERRWSYTMFLAALARYLEIQAERGVSDSMVGYTRQCLLRYANWMFAHERPYLDHPEQLEFPTESWAAQELRKANVLRWAARFADEQQRDALVQRGEAIADRAWRDLLSFPSRTVTRAVAIMLIEGTQDAYFRATPLPPPTRWPHSDVEPRRLFVPQKTRVRNQLRTVPGTIRLMLQLARPVAWWRGVALLHRRWYG